jgi:hypothetical protein
MAKKKKKKEEFDASLMGGYLPGVRTPVSASMSIPMPVAALPKLYQMPSFLQSNFRYLGDDVRAPDPDPPLARKILSAWWQYTGIPSALGGGAGALGIQVASQAPQAKYASPFMHLGFRTAWLLEASIGTAAVAGFFTIMDPDRLWRAPYTGTLDYGEPDFGWKRTTPWAEGTGFQG